jgi:DNA-binding transcriptional MerR regulator
MLTIGEFAARSGLSRSALRFYDQTGLLTPVRVDLENGYRRYGAAQIQQALLVRRLREAEVPLALLRRYLEAAEPERRAILDAHLAVVRERADAVETLVGELRLSLEAEAKTPPRTCGVAAPVLAQGLCQVAFAVADPGERSDLAGVWIETKDDSLRLVATDSHRLVVRDLVPETIGRAALRGMIDAHELAALGQRLVAAATVMISQDEEGSLSVAVDGRRATVGHRGDGFPDYERILIELNRGEQVTLAREDLEASLAELGGGERITMELRPQRLVLAGERQRVSIAVEGWSRGSLLVHLDGRFLAEAVHAMIGPDLLLEVSGPLDPVTLRSADSGTFSVLTMPIRAPEPA